MLQWVSALESGLAHLLEVDADRSAPALCGADAPLVSNTRNTYHWTRVTPDNASTLSFACVFCKLQAEDRGLELPAWPLVEQPTYIYIGETPAQPERDVLQARVQETLVPRPDWLATISGRHSSPILQCDGDPEPVAIRLRLGVRFHRGTTTEVMLGPRDVIQSPAGNREPRLEDPAEILRYEGPTQLVSLWNGQFYDITWRGPSYLHGRHVWNYIEGWDGLTRCTQCGLAQMPVRGDLVPCPLCWSRHPLWQHTLQHGRWRGVPYEGAPFAWPEAVTDIIRPRFGMTALSRRQATQCVRTAEHRFLTPVIFDQDNRRYLRSCDECGVVLSLPATAASWAPDPAPAVQLTPCPVCGTNHRLGDSHRATADYALHQAEDYVARQAATYRPLAAHLIERWCLETDDARIHAVLRRSEGILREHMAAHPERSVSTLREVFFTPLQRGTEALLHTSTPSQPEPTTPLCACGCGQHVKKAQSRFCAGHNTAGYHAERRRAVHADR